MALLHPEAVLTADATAVQAAAANEGRGAPRLAREVRGARAVAETFKGRARAAGLALVDGEPGAVWAPGGTPRAVFVFTIEDDRIAAIDLVVEPPRLAAINVERM
jgi:RNA polymerase sigma-70 factor (ECF subfamily)